MSSSSSGTSARLIVEAAARTAERTEVLEDGFAAKVACEWVGGWGGVGVREWVGGSGVVREWVDGVGSLVGVTMWPSGSDDQGPTVAIRHTVAISRTFSGVTR